MKWSKAIGIYFNAKKHKNKKKPIGKYFTRGDFLLAWILAPFLWLVSPLILYLIIKNIRRIKNDTKD